MKEKEIVREIIRRLELLVSDIESNENQDNYDHASKLDAEIYHIKKEYLSNEI